MHSRLQPGVSQIQLRYVVEVTNRTPRACPGAEARRLWAILLLLLAPLILNSCTETFMAAVGPNEDITLFSDFPVGDARRELLRQFLGRKVDTPVRPEAPFRVGSGVASKGRIGPSLSWSRRW